MFYGLDQVFNILFAIIFYFTKQIKIYALLMILALVHELGHLVCGICLGLKLKSIKITSMNEKNLVKILAAAAIILGIVFISVICIDTHESTSLSVKSPDTLKDSDAYSVELCDYEGNPIDNQNISI